MTYTNVLFAGVTGALLALAAGWGGRPASGFAKSFAAVFFVFWIERGLL